MFTLPILITSTFLVPTSPEDLVYPDFVFTPPSPSSYKESVLDFIPVYIVEDNELPLINVVATFRGGNYLDEEGKVGETSLMASLVRSGGSSSLTAEELDEQFAYLGAVSSVRGGDTKVTASLNSLSSNFENSFDLFLEMLKSPRFQESRLQLEKDSLIETMKQRNDFPSGILKRENKSVLYGDSYLGRDITEESINNIDVSDLQKTHSDIINPSNLIFSISGDFNKKEMLSFLSEKLSDWEVGNKTEPPPEVESLFKPGVFYVDQDVPQGGVRISIRSFKQDDPDVEAARVMNYILGGGGFSSRITQKVRSDEGLAYSAGSRFSAGPWSDGVWSSGFESKNSTVALAAKLIFDEIERIKTEPVSDEDLSLAKNAIIEQFPSMFQSKMGILSVFVNDDLSGRSPLYWETFRDKIGSITAKDVKDVANRMLVPEKMSVVIVGDWEKIKIGDDDNRATISDVSDIVGGETVELPIRDPLTLRVEN